MTISEMDRWEVGYIYLASCMKLYHETLNRVTIFRRKNNKGRLVTSVTAYLLDGRSNVHSLFFKVYDDEYLWLLNRLGREYPDADFEDLTPETVQEKEVV